MNHDKLTNWLVDNIGLTKLPIDNERNPFGTILTANSEVYVCTADARRGDMFLLNLKENCQSKAKMLNEMADAIDRFLGSSNKAE